MFSITKMTVDGNNKVVSLDWCYENADGKYSDTHTLHTPEGNVPIALVTNDVALGWLTSQLGNTSEEFDAYLAELKAQVAYQETFCEYLPNDQGRFTKVAEDPIDPSFGVDPDPDPVATPY